MPSMYLNFFLRDYLRISKQYSTAIFMKSCCFLGFFPNGACKDSSRIYYVVLRCRQGVNLGQLVKTTQQQNISTVDMDIGHAISGWYFEKASWCWWILIPGGEGWVMQADLMSRRRGGHDIHLLEPAGSRENSRQYVMKRLRSGGVCLKGGCWLWICINTNQER